VRPNRQLSTSLARTAPSAENDANDRDQQGDRLRPVRELAKVRQRGGALRIGELGLVAARELVETGRIVYRLTCANKVGLTGFEPATP
jgi:hypothetical protein